MDRPKNSVYRTKKCPQGQQSNVGISDKDRRASIAATVTREKRLTACVTPTTTLDKTIESFVIDTVLNMLYIYISSSMQPSTGIANLHSDISNQMLGFLQINPSTQTQQ
jgi:hypothetical protein